MLDLNVPPLFTPAMTGKTKIAKLRRVRLLEQDGGGTLHFIILGSGRADFLDKEQVPDFPGEEAWFELERVRGPVWMTWKVLRQVDEPRSGIA